MGKIDDKAQDMVIEAKKVDKSISEDLVIAACKYLGPSLFRKDAALVAYSSKKELETIRENFVKKKLGVKDSDADIDAVIKKIGVAYGMSNRAKKRAVIYACLMKNYGVTSL